MRQFLEAQLDKLHPYFKEGGKLHWAWPVFEMGETIALTPGAKTKAGSHVRDPMDAKRLMTMVIYACLPAVIFGMWNVGYQGYLAEGYVDPPLLQSLIRGAWYMLPVYIVTYAAGGIWELVFCIVRKHEVNEGFLVTGLLFPLTLPPTIPLWMVAMGISFGVVIGKEVFGGVGMNILNPALTARAFVFFTYPASISGAKVWDVAGANNPLVSRYSEVPVDGYTGATPLLEVANATRGTNAVEVLEAAGWTFTDLLFGFVPGSMGEVSALAILLGGVFLIVTGIASYRIMIGCVIGIVGLALLANGVAGEESLALMTIPPHYHLVMGGFAFGAVFMATDPVSAASTTTGQWIYGISIGVLAGLVRVFNPAYPEGMMLAILFMNVFAPLIDYYVVQGTTRRRAARMKAA